METVTLEVQSRKDGLTAYEVRSEGQIPANFYGLKQKNRNLSIDYQTFRRIYDTAGRSTVLELVIDGKDKTNVLIHDIQYDPVTDKFTHIDFKFVDLDKEITTEVPIVAVGESKAVRELQGTLMQNRDVLTIKCQARNIPQKIEFDITPLEDFNSSIHVSDIKLPEGVEAMDDEKLTIATVIAQRAEEEPEVEEVAEGEEGAEGEAAEGEAKEGEAKEGEKAEGGKEGEKAEGKGEEKAEKA